MLARHGYGVLLFDRRGEGESDGDPTSWGWGNEKDLKAAIGFLQRRADVDPARIGGLGLSVGGEMMIQTAAETSGSRRSRPRAPACARCARPSTRRRRWTRSLGIPFKAVETAATAVFHDQAPPASLVDLVAKIEPRPLLLMYSGEGQGGEVQLNPDSTAPQASRRRSGRSRAPGTPADPRAARRVRAARDRVLRRGVAPMTVSPTSRRPRPQERRDRECRRSACRCGRRGRGARRAGDGVGRSALSLGG